MIGYGAFLNNVISFLLVALALFFVIRVMNRLRLRQEAASAEPPAQEKLLREIRDILKAQTAGSPDGSRAPEATVQVTA